jgi:hypothetical protein
LNEVQARILCPNLYNNAPTLFPYGGREPRNTDKMRLAFPKEEFTHNIFL